MIYIKIMKENVYWKIFEMIYNMGAPSGAKIDWAFTENSYNCTEKESFIEEEAADKNNQYETQLGNQYGTQEMRRCITEEYSIQDGGKWKLSMTCLKMMPRTIHTVSFRSHQVLEKAW